MQTIAVKILTPAVICLLLFNWTAKGVSPGGTGTAARQHTMLKQNTAHNELLLIALLETWRLGSHIPRNSLMNTDVNQSKFPSEQNLLRDVTSAL
jgi:hypothetical protein